MFQFSKALLLFSAHWRTGPGISMAPTGIWFQPWPWSSVVDATLHREVRGKGPFHAPWAEERKQPATCFNQSMQDIILPQESPRITNHCKQCGWLRLNCGDGPLESWYHVFKEPGGVQKGPSILIGRSSSDRHHCVSIYHAIDIRGDTYTYPWWTVWFKTSSLNTI